MRPIFADTSFLIALMGREDAFHARAVALTQTVRRPFVVTQWVLMELGNALCKKSKRSMFSGFMQSLDQMAVQVLPANEASFTAGLELFEQRSDKEWSLVDCISFCEMERLQLREALTLDHHFIQAGYHALLLDN